MPLPATYDATLTRVTEALQLRLRDNLHSLVLYGSAVRGDLVEDVSDINLLVVLRVSTPEAHAVIAELVKDRIPVDPFVVSLRRIDRTLQVFALKFRSIRRDYRVLHGTDPFAEMQTDEPTLRFICEQQLRNLLLRSAHAFILFGKQGERYQRFLTRTEPMLLALLSELVHLDGHEVPDDHDERIEAIASVLDIDAGTLRTLRDLHDRPHPLEAAEAFDLHARMYRALERAVAFLEQRWPKPQP